jgi:hypothetical protein
VPLRTDIPVRQKFSLPVLLGITHDGTAAIALRDLPSQRVFRLFVVGSRCSQIPDHQARYVVHKPSFFLVGEDVGATQDYRMGQRFHYCH